MIEKDLDISNCILSKIPYLSILRKKAGTTLPRVGLKATNFIYTFGVEVQTKESA